MRAWHKLFIAALVFAIPIIGVGQAHATSSRDDFRRYVARNGDVVLLKKACFRAEDSAFHPKTLEWRHGGDKVVIGCYRKGY